MKLHSCWWVRGWYNLISFSAGVKGIKGFRFRFRFRMHGQDSQAYFMWKRGIQSIRHLGRLLCFKCRMRVLACFVTIP